jgi:hypothetical protein
MKAKANLRDDTALARHPATCAFPSTIKQDSKESWSVLIAFIDRSRRKDPEVQLFPEIAVSIIGQDHMRAGEQQGALEIFKLNLLAYPGLVRRTRGPCRCVFG